MSAGHESKSPLGRDGVDISVVVPAYNAAAWLPLSVPAIDGALAESGLARAEIVIVDDGSTDGTAEVASGLETRFPLRVVTQENGGRFLARKRGAEEALYGFVLFVDSRVLIDRGSLRYLREEMARDGARQVWVGHVNIETSNMYARFWSAVAFIAWRRYFANPRACSFGLDDFDHYPKGTGCFFVPRDVIRTANQRFLRTTTDYRNANDDTRLIRDIAGSHRIHLSPEYSCTYHARSNFRQYVHHVFHRGQVFVDGFLRRDGNRFFWVLVLFLAATVVVPVVLALFPQTILLTSMTAIAVWIVGFVAALLLGTPRIEALSLFLLAPVFVVVYGLGIWVAVGRRLRRRHSPLLRTNE